MAAWRCIVCGKRVFFRFLLCPACHDEHGEYKTWPEWLIYLAKQERSRRYRQANQVHEYSDSSLDAILEIQRRQGSHDHFWVWSGYVSDGMDRLMELRMDLVEVLACLTTEELAILLLHQFGFSYNDIADILGIGRDAAWGRWVKARKRLREASTSQPEPL